MLADIGVMIGMYILTRMVSMVTRKGERVEAKIVGVFAVLTFIVTVIVIFDLFVRGTTTQLPQTGN